MSRQDKDVIIIPGANQCGTKQLPGSQIEGVLRFRFDAPTDYLLAFALYGRA